MNDNAQEFSATAVVNAIAEQMNNAAIRGDRNEVTRLMNVIKSFGMNDVKIGIPNDHSIMRATQM